MFLRFGFLFGIAIACQSLQGPANAATFNIITGSPSSGRSPDFYLSLSADGSTVAGSGYSGGPYRWTAAGGKESVNDLPGGEGIVKVVDVSGDGSTLLAEVGFNQWVLWNDQGEIQPIFDRNLYRATAISADGLTVVGYESTPSQSALTAIRWRADTGVVPLVEVSPGRSSASDVSGNGNVIAGWIRSDADHYSAFQWQTGDGDFTMFEPLPTGETISAITAVSRNGKHFLGSIDVNGQNQSVILRENRPPVYLAPTAGQLRSIAYGISDDGNRVVGVIDDLSRGNWAFLWDPEHGVRDLRDVLANDYGLADELDDLILRRIRGMSADGRTILGVAWKPSGPNSHSVSPFVVTVPEPSTIAVALLSIPAAILCRGRFRQPRSKREKPGMH